MKRETKNCCGCGKEIVLDTVLNEDGLARWYGKFNKQELVKVICCLCFKDERKKRDYIEK